MHEEKRLRAKCLRVRGFEIVLRLLFPTTPSTPWLRSEPFRAIFDFSRLRSDHFRSFFDVWRLRSEHFRALFDVRRHRSQHFRAFSTSGSFGASIFDDFRRLEAPRRGFSRFLEAASRKITPGRKAFLHNCCIDICWAQN